MRTADQKIDAIATNNRTRSSFIREALDEIISKQKILSGLRSLLGIFCSIPEQKSLATDCSGFKIILMENLIFSYTAEKVLEHLTQCLTSKRASKNF